MRTAAQTAILLAVMLNRSEQNRARVSAKTIKNLAERKNLRNAFLVDVIDELAEYSWMMCDIGGGICIAIKYSTIDSFKTITTQRLLTDVERRALQRGNIGWEALKREAEPETHDDDDDDDDDDEN